MSDFSDTSSIESFVPGSESDESDQMQVVSGVHNPHQDEPLAERGDELEEVIDDPCMLTSAAREKLDQVENLRVFFEMRSEK